MLDANMYAVQSLELHLFFARIMKEHALFMEAAFTQKDVSFAGEADAFKEQFEGILMNVVEVSNGIISNEVLSSGEIVTDFTLGSEQKTQNFTGIPINERITMLESRLYSSTYATVQPELVNYVREINQYAKTALAGLIHFKEQVLNDVLSCKMFTGNYPLLIEHIIHEARLYQSQLVKLENGGDLNDADTRQEELFWNQIMMEHSLFIRGLLDPSEGDLINTANDFASNYANLIQRAKEATEETMDEVTKATLAETMGIKDFKTAGTKGINECKIRSIILPLLADHVLREANHYIRLLKNDMKS